MFVLFHMYTMALPQRVRVLRLNPGVDSFLDFCRPRSTVVLSGAQLHEN